MLFQIYPCCIFEVVVQHRPLQNIENNCAVLRTDPRFRLVTKPTYCKYFCDLLCTSTVEVNAKVWLVVSTNEDVVFLFPIQVHGPRLRAPASQTFLRI